MSDPTRTPIRVRVDPLNPGQFFACCGLLELADRFWGGAESWFSNGAFHLRPLPTVSFGHPTLSELLEAIAQAPLTQLDSNDDFSSPLEMAIPIPLRLDWWKDDRGGGARFKVWAGSMRGVRIARAMQSVLKNKALHNDRLLDFGTVVFDPLENDKKVEPFYFDARRGASASALDIGFAPDSLGMTSTAYPAVEFLCLVGLQRCQPAPAGARRVFDYHTWTEPVAALNAPLAVCGLLPEIVHDRFRFEVAFRTNQRKHKAFTPATQSERS